MPYEIRVEPLPRRFEQIKASAGSSKQSFPFNHFRDRQHDLRVISVPVSFPVYRMANFRTNVQQLTIAREKSLGAEFFSKGEEDATAQQEQHELLWRLAQRGQGTSIIAVSKVLKQDGQTQPLLATAWGIIVNGNRRLAAMRELSIDDARFDYVDIMILPEDATEDEIVDIELSLQMAPETKLPYGWTNDALAIESLQARNMDKQRVLLKMRLTENEYDERLGALAQGRLFLSEFVEEPEQYDLIEDQKQLFFNGYKAVRNKKDSKSKELVRAILYNIADHPTEFGTRAYDFITPFEKHAPAVTALLKREIEQDLSNYQPPSQGPSDDGDGLIPISISGNAELTEDDKLVTFLLDKTNREAVHFAIKEAVEQFKEGTSKAGDADKERLRKAKKHISNVTFDQVSEESLKLIPGLISDIEILLQSVKERLRAVKPTAIAGQNSPGSVEVPEDHSADASGSSQ